MSTLRKRLDTVEDRIALQQHRELQRQFKGRSLEEQEFFCAHGYWPENASELPHRNGVHGARDQDDHYRRMARWTQEDHRIKAVTEGHVTGQL